MLQGSWGGAGTKKVAPKPHLVKKVAGIDPSSRADYKKAHVIISEKRDKKAAKYLVKDLPYPYTSKAQFERSMEVPLGTEWNTRLGFQRATLPKVVTKVRVACSDWAESLVLTRAYDRWGNSSLRSKSNTIELQMCPTVHHLIFYHTLMLEITHVHHRIAFLYLHRTIMTFPSLAQYNALPMTFQPFALTHVSSNSPTSRFT